MIKEYYSQKNLSLSEIGMAISGLLALVILLTGVGVTISSMKKDKK